MAYPKGKPKSEESKRKVSASLKAMWTDERRTELSLKCRGEGNPFYGKTHSLETMERLRAANIGRVHSAEHREKVSKSLLGNQRAKGNHFSLTMEQCNAISKRQIGSTNSCWRGGATSEHARIRSSAQYVAWRNSVYERDNYTCQDCGMRGGYLHAHHVKPFSSYPELRFEVSNGLTLCADCHKFTDTYGINKSTKTERRLSP